MTRNMKKLSLMLIVLLLITSRAVGQTTLDKCDAALRARGEQVSLCELGLKFREEEIGRLGKEVTELREENRPSFWNNPVVWAAAGVILGTYIGSRVVR